MKKLIITVCCTLVLAGVVTFLYFDRRSKGGLVPELLATIRARPLGEVSGMVKSRSYPNTFWVVNDSRNDARLFAINREGNNIIPTFSRFSFYGEDAEPGKDQWQGFKVLYAENIDWESMSADANYLYVADTGNNFNNRKDLGIYMLSEIDPTASTQSAAIRYLPIRYPDQDDGSRHYDSEALFSADDKLYLITKHRSRSGMTMKAGAKLYRLDTMHTDQDNILVLVDTHPDMLAVTGAELSPDGNTLAVISYTDFWLFDRPASVDKWLSSSARRYALETRVVNQVETVVWDDDTTLLLTNEQRSLFRLDLTSIGETSL